MSKEYLYSIDTPYFTYKIWLVKWYDGEWFKTRTIHPKKCIRLANPLKTINNGKEIPHRHRAE